MNLARDARLLFVGLILQADDEGRGVADPRKLKAVVFGGDEDVTARMVADWLGQIEHQGLAVLYDGNGHGRLYYLPTFLSHQYIQKRKPSVYPSPGIVPDQSRKANGSVPDKDGTHIVGSDLKDRKDLKGSDRRGSEGEGAPAASPPATPHVDRGALAPISRRVNRNLPAPEQEPEVMRIAKALQVLKADPKTQIGDAARMFRVSVAAIEAAQAAVKRAAP